MASEMIITGVADQPDGARRPFTLRIPLRPLFAAATEIGLLSNPGIKIEGVSPAITNPSDREAIAEASWLMADTMLKWLEEKPQEGEVQNDE